MHFTVVFEGHESYDISYSLVFTPVPVWMKGDREIVHLHRDRPHYEKGDLAPLLEREPIEARLAPGRRNAVIVIHSTGHGTQDYLAALASDLKASGFNVQQIAFE